MNATASINDFKILNQKCKKYYNLFLKSNKFHLTPGDEKLQERFGFYFFILESLCDVKDIDILRDFITDTEFNAHLTGNRLSDHGIDAIYIDEEKKNIKLFNFKFRETFRPGQAQSTNDAFISTKLVNAILNSDASSKN